MKLTELERELICEAFKCGRIYGTNGEKEFPSHALEKCFDSCEEMKMTMGW